MDTPLQLIVGLGNPGPEYDRTRHNAGADFVTELARRYGASLSPESKFFGDTSRLSIEGRDLRLLIPTTFMNRSGQAMERWRNFIKFPPKPSLSPTAHSIYRPAPPASSPAEANAATTGSAIP